MSKRSITMMAEQAEHDFVSKVAEHYGISRADVLLCLYRAGKRVFLAQLRARVMVNRIKDAQNTKEVVGV